MDNESFKFENTENNLTKIYQVELLSHLLKFDEVCRKYEIKYTLHGGSMLGAIRHNGFIPWDDDVDIAMTAHDFEKFKSLICKEMPDYYISESESPSPRLLMKHYNGRPIVWIDFLEYNHISENKIEQKIKIYLLTFLSGMCRNKFTIKNSTIKKHGLFKIILLYLTYYFGKLFPMQFKLKMHRYVSRKMFQGNGTLIHRSNDQVKSIKYIMPDYYMKSYEDIMFEGKKLRISSYYKEMLVMDFGENYLIPPPIGERGGHDEIVRIVCEKMQEEYEKKHPL